MKNLARKRTTFVGRVYLTAKETRHQLSNVAVLPFEHRTSGSSGERVFVDPARRFQSIVGFGGSLTDAAAETFAKLPADKQQELITAYFDPQKGIGYTLGRTNINSCDFSSDMYTYCAEGDVELKTFSINHDRAYKIPLIKRALERAGREFSLFASPWSPPAWMKNSMNMLYGGHLLPAYRSAWAQYFVKFIEHYAKEGIPLWGITVQNEPEAAQTWESCIYTPEDERDFIRDHLGPALEDAGLSRVRVIAWDHNRTDMYERARVILSNRAAARFVWGIGYHWYCGECYSNVSLVKEVFPDTHLLFTEGCDGPYKLESLNEWSRGEQYGAAVIQDINHGCEGWCDWNILLDMSGGPNHVGNYCFAPVHANIENGTLIYTNAFHYLGHFSKFIRPGFARIACSSFSDQILASAFVNPCRPVPDGTVIVIMNKADWAQRVNIIMGDTKLSPVMPAHSIATIVVENA